MAIDALLSLEVIEAMENYMARIRSPEHIRPKLDIAYKIEDQSFVIFEIRPRWDNAGEKLEIDVARATLVKANNNWKVFWKRADRKWHAYPEQPTVATIEAFIELVEEDKNGCFWG